MAFSFRKDSAARTVGLDIEPGRVVAAEVTVNGNVQLERVATAELPVGVVRDARLSTSRRSRRRSSSSGAITRASGAT